MATILTDQEIEMLILEPKTLPQNWRSRFVPKPKHGHREREQDITGELGSQFRVILRESIANPLGFSVILAYCPITTNQLFRLRRYNGKDHEHTNKLEKQRFYALHIHRATERYQRSGLREDAFAEPTDRFSDLDSALVCLLRDCAFENPDSTQLAFFGMEW